jgi:hypothetical protein
MERLEQLHAKGGGSARLLLDSASRTPRPESGREAQRSGSASPFAGLSKSRRLDRAQLPRQWRFDQLRQLGFGEEHARLLAEPDADLNRAHSLVAVGCPFSVAVRILV